MRAQPEEIQSPEKTMEHLSNNWGTSYQNQSKVPVWSFTFTVTHNSVFDDGTDKLGYLSADCNDVPVITRLEEWNEVSGSLSTGGEFKNICFEVTYE